MIVSFPDITLLITHFNRSDSLKRLLVSLKALQVRFAEIIVSDDGSSEEHLSALNVLNKSYPFNLITTPTNKGLGNNINKGQDAVKTDFTLYIQEDFIPHQDFIPALTSSLILMEKNDELDLIRFFAMITYPYLQPYRHNPEFLEMYIPPFAARYPKIYMYSDTPHLRRTSFFKKFGKYREDLGGDRMEYWMCISFIKNGGKALIHREFRTLISHANSDEEPSTIPRAMWRQKRILPLTIIRNIYRQLKYNYDLYLRCVTMFYFINY